MTIVQKWSLMLSSLRDIKAAIEEMGGAASGIAEYAKGVRSIYSTEEYTPKYRYPARGGTYMEYISSQMLFLVAIKEEIRLAIVDGGVECDTAVPLSQYGDKIRQINTLRIATTYIDIGEYKGECSGQLEASGGQPPYTWAVSGNWLPSGITLSSDGALSGTAGSQGTYSVYFTVTDSAGQSKEAKIYVNVNRKTIYVWIEGSNTIVYDGQPHTVTLACSDPDAVLTVTYGAAHLDSVTEIGEYSVNITPSQGYKLSSGSGNLTVRVIAGDTSQEV